MARVAVVALQPADPMSDALLELAVDVLGPLVDELVFVGGATIHLWITEETAPPIRATEDVDVICDVATYAAYTVFSERLRETGLREAADEKVVCRWRHAATKLIVDVMPTDENILGFTNPWYELGMETAIVRELPSGRSIRAVRPPVVLATKLAAWRGRGQDDLLRSLDAHDIVVLINGRPELLDELTEQSEPLRQYVSSELEALGSDPYFDYLIQDTVTGYGPNAAPVRAELVRERITAIIAQLRAA